MPGTYRVAVASEGLEVGMEEQQQDLQLEVCKGPYVMAIAMAHLEPGQPTAGAKVSVQVQLTTHSGAAVKASDAELTQTLKRMCKVKLGTQSFSCSGGDPLTFEGQAPAKPGIYLLTAHWVEERSSHKYLKPAIAKKLPWTENLKASSRYPCGLLKADQQVTVVTGQAHQLLSDTPLVLKPVHPAAPMLPELAWKLADAESNTINSLTQEELSGGQLRFRVSIQHRSRWKRQALQQAHLTFHALKLQGVQCMSGAA